jgi:hypothetical protein
MPLPSNGDGSLTNLSRPIHLGSHSPIAQVISPLSSLKSQHLGGPFHISYSLEQLPSSIAPFVTPSFVTSSCLIAPSIVTSFTTPFRDPLVVSSSTFHVSPYVVFIVPSLIVPFDLPSNATLLLPTYAHPNSNGNNLHVDSPTSSEKVIDLCDLFNTDQGPNLVPCPPIEKLKKSYDHTRMFQVEWVTKLPWARGSLLMMANFIWSNARYATLLT